MKLNDQNKLNITPFVNNLSQRVKNKSLHSFLVLAEILYTNTPVYTASFSTDLFQHAFSVIQNGPRPENDYSDPSCLENKSHK